MITKYSGVSSEVLHEKLLTCKRMYDNFSRSLEAHKRILNNSKEKNIGRIFSREGVIEKHSYIKKQAKNNLEELYYEYLSFSRNGFIPELVENPKDSTKSLLIKYKNHSKQVYELWQKYKHIPKRGINDGEARHNHIEEMKKIEKEIYKRFFN